ncbi:MULTISPECIES: hypothetical protein [Paraburkholderia]|uniref:hypothetical protein n=1 Tax=Paraburkholderia TaxID=1822464 RepID=UPI0038B9D4D2
MADRSAIEQDKDDFESLDLLKIDFLTLGMPSAFAKTLPGIIKRDSPATNEKVQP